MEEHRDMDTDALAGRLELSGDCNMFNNMLHLFSRTKFCQVPPSFQHHPDHVCIFRLLIAPNKCLNPHFNPAKSKAAEIKREKQHEAKKQHCIHTSNTMLAISRTAAHQEVV